MARNATPALRAKLKHLKDITFLILLALCGMREFLFELFGMLYSFKLLPKSASAR